MFFPECDPTSELEQQVSAALADAREDSCLIGVIETLAARHGQIVYKTLLRLLVGKHFSTDAAQKVWHAAQAHRESVFRPGFDSRSLRIALIDYLYREMGELTDPRVLDAEFLYNITRTSVTDGLTGLFHQTYFKQNLDRVLANRRRSIDFFFAVVLLDLDHFKQFNDRCGHLAGDEALRRTAEIIRSNLREGDVAARYGGEEFALLLVNSNRTTAFAVADRIRAAIETENFPCQDLLDSGNLTISGGIAVHPDDGDSVDTLIAAADVELYNAKSRRNTIFPHAGDRRLSPRRAVRSLVEYAPFEGALYRPALSLDISRGGIALGCENLLEPGTILSLRLTRPFWQENLQISAMVRQVRKRGDLIFVGLEFDRNIDPLDRLLPRTAAPANCESPSA